MKIRYSNDKAVQIWQRFVENQADRAARRMFDKHFGATLAKRAIVLHEMLEQASNAHSFNAGQSANTKLEVMRGRRDNEHIVLKVRVNDAWRKFFNIIQSNGDALSNAMWQGNYAEVNSLEVIDVNKHNYKAL